MFADALQLRCREGGMPGDVRDQLHGIWRAVRKDPAVHLGRDHRANERHRDGLRSVKDIQHDIVALLDIRGITNELLGELVNAGIVHNPLVKPEYENGQEVRGRVVR